MSNTGLPRMKGADQGAWLDGMDEKTWARLRAALDDGIASGVLVARFGVSHTCLGAVRFCRTLEEAQAAAQERRRSNAEKARRARKDGRWERA